MGFVQFGSTALSTTIIGRPENLLPAELGNCVKVEVAALGSQSLTVLMVSVDGKQH